MLHAGRTARVVVWGRLCCPLTPTYTGVPCPTRSHPPGPAPRRKPSWPTTTAHPTPGVEVRVEDWRDHKTERPYDSVISVAAFEAFVHRGMEPAAKMAAYREFFDCCHRMLVDEGRLSIQTIAYVKPSTYVPALITDKIFPESELPLIWEPIAAAEGMFELLALRNDSDHYYRTLRIWDDNLAACHDQAVALVGEPTVKDFRQYLRISASGFKRGHICLLRMSFRKR